MAPQSHTHKKKQADVQESFSFHRSKHMSSRIFLEKGILQNLSHEFLDANLSSPHYLITDKNVDANYGSEVLESLKSCGYRTTKIVVPAGETSKALLHYASLLEEILALGIDKHTTIFSLGGGVINNLSGMVAAVLYRGIRLVHFCTSMMSQVDAAIDFKQAVNSKYGKNLVGAYYPASLIVIDPLVLTSLTDRHLKNGIAECIKHALAQDEQFLDWMIQNSDNLDDGDVLETIVRQTCELKVPTLNADQSNNYNEMVPQYGHCLGHAMEHNSKYDLLHGEAISVGMVLCAELSVILGLAEEDLVERHIEAFQAFDLPVYVPKSMSAEQIIRQISYDKHYTNKCPNMGLLTEIGSMYEENGNYAHRISYDLVQAAVERNIARRQAATSHTANN